MICSIMLSNRHRRLDAGRGTMQITMQIVNTMDGSHQDVNRLVALENIEQTLADREETESSPGKKCCPNKRLFSQRRERAHLEVADFRHELIERLPSCFAFLTQEAKPPQVIERSFAQLLSRASEQNGAAQHPGGNDSID